MKRHSVFLFLFLLASCTRDFTIKVGANVTQLVVEAYLNNEKTDYNYVLLSRSQDYFSLDTTGLAVSGASVSITEGTADGSNGIVWDDAGKIVMTEMLPGAPAGGLPGAYFDPRLRSDSAHSLHGIPGRYYLLQIDVDGSHYSSITGMPPVVPLDSLTVGYYNSDAADSDKPKAHITVNYQDPDTLGNAELFFRRSYDNENDLGWGGLRNSRGVNATDDKVNGQYVRLTLEQNYSIGDLVTIQMASVTRPVYDFWDSFDAARANGGPFATPVILKTNITGENVTGCFSGFSTSTRSVLVK